MTKTRIAIDDQGVEPEAEAEAEVEAQSKVEAEIVDQGHEVINSDEKTDKLHFLLHLLFFKTCCSNI